MDGALPIASPSQIGLNLLRSPTLPEIAAARAETAKRPGGAAEAFSLGPAGDAEPSGEADKPVTPASFKRFEAMVLQTFIQNMLPKEGAAVYGKGMAGDMWKSMLAEKIAQVMADRGGIGIADRVLADRYAAAAKTRPDAQTATANPAAASHGEPRADSLPPIAPAVLDGMQRSLSELLGDEVPASSKTEIPSTTQRG